MTDKELRERRAMAESYCEVVDQRYLATIDARDAVIADLEQRLRTSEERVRNLEEEKGRRPTNVWDRIREAVAPATKSPYEPSRDLVKEPEPR
jgi:hypothetical protein